MNTTTKPASPVAGILALVGLLLVLAFGWSILVSGASHSGNATPWVEPVTGSCHTVIDDQGRGVQRC